MDRVVECQQVTERARPETPGLALMSKMYLFGRGKHREIASFRGLDHVPFAFSDHEIEPGRGALGIYILEIQEVAIRQVSNRGNCGVNQLWYFMHEGIRLVVIFSANANRV